METIQQFLNINIKHKYIRGSIMRINYIDKDDITKQEFEAYVLVQMSGQYNMIMEATSAMKDAGLTREEYFDIIKNYGKYYNEYVKAE